ncbi:hypothetical protein [Endozoicomonas acroporae]|uniref:hypothetical protein n=1 Tax=Endozoicomonas acroporae TaxID=1701104 RepID=UPI003D7BE6A1
MHNLWFPYLQTDEYAGYGAVAEKEDLWYSGSAIFYSLIESAKANGLELYDYLCREL